MVKHSVGSIMHYAGLSSAETEKLVRTDKNLDGAKYGNAGRKPVRGCHTILNVVEFHITKGKYP